MNTLPKELIIYTISLINDRNSELYLTSVNKNLYKFRYLFFDKYDIDMFNDVPEDDMVKIINAKYCVDYTKLVNAKKISFYCDFNEPVDNLPSKLIYLKFGDYFNRPVNNLPSGLIYLKFGQFFNHPVDHLPSGIKKLSFGEFFDQPVDNLPPGLIELKFGDSFDQPIDKLPSSITSLDLSKSYFHQLIDKLPSNLKYIALPESCNYGYYDDIQTLLSKNIIVDIDAGLIGSSQVFLVRAS